jgi:hypothetical protein
LLTPLSLPLLPLLLLQRVLTAHQQQRMYQALLLLTLTGCQQLQG